MRVSMSGFWVPKSPSLTTHTLHGAVRHRWTGCTEEVFELVTPSILCLCVCQLRLSVVLLMWVSKEECSTLRIRNISSLTVTSHCNTGREAAKRKRWDEDRVWTRAWRRRWWREGVTALKKQWCIHVGCLPWLRFDGMCAHFIIFNVSQF